jgi:hypothetical protein
MDCGDITSVTTHCISTQGRDSVLCLGTGPCCGVHRRQAAHDFRGGDGQDDAHCAHLFQSHPASKRARIISHLYVAPTVCSHRRYCPEAYNAIKPVSRGRCTHASSANVGGHTNLIVTSMQALLNPAPNRIRTNPLLHRANLGSLGLRC